MSTLQLEIGWLREWVDTTKHVLPLRLPLQLPSDGLRAGQGYLFKMPAEFVERWAILCDLAEALDERAEALSGCILGVTSAVALEVSPSFRPKNEEDYTAVISASFQRRTRTHERLVRVAGEWLTARGVVIANSHPKDLEILAPVSIIVEAKVVRQRDPLFAVREAIGQLQEYKYFIGPNGARLAILLDVEPPAALISYSEEYLRVAVLWLLDATLSGGPLAQVEILNVVDPPPR